MVVIVVYVVVYVYVYVVVVVAVVVDSGCGGGGGGGVLGVTFVQKWASHSKNKTKQNHKDSRLNT